VAFIFTYEVIFIGVSYFSNVLLTTLSWMKALTYKSRKMLLREQLASQGVHQCQGQCWHGRGKPAALGANACSQPWSRHSSPEYQRLVPEAQLIGCRSTLGLASDLNPPTDGWVPYIWDDGHVHSFLYWDGVYPVFALADLELQSSQSLPPE
jgi:hypothetical protein